MTTPYARAAPSFLIDCPPQRVLRTHIASATMQGMDVFGLQAFSPPQIAASVDAIGVAKARLPLTALVMLAVVAGGFIGLGALYYTVVVSDPSLPFAAARVLGGVAFSMGLILVVITGAGLFTGRNLLAMAWADRITVGDIVGGSVMVATVYHLVYNVALRNSKPQ